MIPEWVKKYIGIPYAVKGNTSKSLDCLGLVELIYLEQFNIKLPYNEHLDTKDMKGTKAAISLEKVKWNKCNKPKCGDVILLKIAGYPVHMGIILNENEMIHSLKGHNSVIERFTGTKWKHRIDGFYSYGT